MTQEDALNLMAGRGYKDICRSMAGDKVNSISFIKAINSELAIDAKVMLIHNTVYLSITGLDYFCTVATTGFDVHHKDFEEYEQALAMYGAKCLELDLHSILTNLKKAEYANDGDSEIVKKDIKTRKRQLWDQIIAIGKKRDYPKEECLSFYEYWVQMNEGGVKMQFEIMKTRKGVFDVGGRLATWMKNKREWKDAKKDIVEKKIDTQNSEAKKTTSINKDQLF